MLGPAEDYVDGIFVKDGVCGEHGHFLDSGLSDQEAIERVMVMKREIGDGESMLVRNIERQNSPISYPLRDAVCGRLGQCQPAYTEFDGDFPRRGGREEERAAFVLEKVARGPIQLVRRSKSLEENVRVEEVVHGSGGFAAL